MKMILTGDSFIARRLPTNEEGLEELQEIISSSDARFTNLEITTHNLEGNPAPFSGGTWAVAKPEVLDDLLQYGFNLYNWANNHSLDYLYGGLLATERELNKRSLVHVGVGQTLSAAAEPRYLETNKGRVAIIGATSSFHESWIAADANKYVQGRPGVNPLRFQEINYVEQEQLDILKDIAKKTYMNADEDILVKEGFITRKEGDPFNFGGKKFKVADRTYSEKIPLQEDMDRFIRSIKEAKRQSDYVIVSIHSHEMGEDDKAKPADFMEIAARQCIDAGADCIAGHGPHIIRGIEIYKGKPIFYSLGNFIFQNESVTHLPDEFFNKYDLPPTATIADALDVRTDNGKRGLGANPHVWESVTAEVLWEGKTVSEIRLKPLDLGFGKPRYEMGLPKLTDDTTVLERMQELSKPYGTDITIENGEGIIRF